MPEDKKNNEKKEQNPKKDNPAEKEKKAVKSSGNEERKDVKKQVHKEAAKSQLDNLKDSVPEDIPPTAPVNPFEQHHEVLPNSNEEEASLEANDEEFEENDDVSIEESVAPVNPFEVASSPIKESSLDKKSLESKPLEEKVEVKAETTEAEEKASVGDKQPEDSSVPDEPVVVDAVVETVNSSPESSEVEVVDIPEVDESPKLEEVQSNLGQDEFSEEFWDILEQAGISKKKLIVFIGIFVVLVVIVIGIFSGWFSFLSFDFGGDDDAAEIIEVVDNVPDVDVEIVDQEKPSQTYTQPAFPIISSYIFGLQYSSDADSFAAVPVTGFSTDAAIGSSIIFGLDEPISEDAFVGYVSLLNDLRNAYNTDIYDYLDKSTDRQARLDEFIADFEDLNARGYDTFQQLTSDLQVLDVNFDAAVVERDIYEENFFTSLNAMEGNAALREFDNFLILEERVLTIKARFGAYEALREMYRRVLELTIPRLEDIKANEEALVEGIRVFDVPGSDIDAILPLEFNFPE